MSEPIISDIEIKLNISEPEDIIWRIIRNKCGAWPRYGKIVKKSLDARDKNHICWRYQVQYSLQPYTPPEKTYEKVASDKKIAIIGAGPAGLFCAVRLVQHGLKPVIIERGEDVKSRAETCRKFFDERELDTSSNILFGEGGAGAFSDGKLNTQTRENLNDDVLELFVKFGAPKEILYNNKPHVGSDNLYNVLQNIRRFLEDNGVTYMFNTTFTGFSRTENRISSLQLKNSRTGEESELPVDVAVLCPGHSARDTFEMLDGEKIHMEPTEFSIGVRIEHLSEAISKAQYGKNYKLLPPADYKLVSHAHERTVFTFCMCPGGMVIPAVNEEGELAINGMSMFARDGANSNSALMVQMKRKDFGADDLFAGMRFQREIERKAFACGKDYSAPVQLYKDFKSNRVSSGYGEVTPSYPVGCTFAPLGEILPPVCVEAIKAAIPDMGRRLKGFDSPSAVMTGVETRFSSPVKIVRDRTCQSVSLKGLYPCGEGAGYSGGITSSAADGLFVAEAVARNLQ
ncbi:MAG: NAD(P)/FAD-dependent oxidoreductase [Clostridia bacterium]|nr:NAD(P)/FAD-dependent oxidoreductase [Clostridia bacterium]